MSDPTFVVGDRVACADEVPDGAPPVFTGVVIGLSHVRIPVTDRAYILSDDNRLVLSDLAPDTVRCVIVALDKGFYDPTNERGIFVSALVCHPSNLVKEES